jgi:hypothetical protein
MKSLFEIKLINEIIVWYDIVIMVRMMVSLLKIIKSVNCVVKTRERERDCDEERGF